MTFFDVLSFTCLRWSKKNQVNSTCAEKYKHEYIVFRKPWAMLEMSASYVMCLRKQTEIKDPFQYAVHYEDRQIYIILIFKLIAITT